ncbi:MAG TPA: nuclear transport factor 2 family protein [Acidimicrobiales bacterium]|nr:nuclear transport factor 2 family protein [Acidimicrobiales bacterium]
MPEEQSNDETLAVIKHHLEAVLSGDPTAMAYDYSESAVIERETEKYAGITQITAYFETVPDRMGSAIIEFGEPEVVGEIASFKWRITSDDSISSGFDTVVIRNGQIVKQVVKLDSIDF